MAFHIRGPETDVLMREQIRGRWPAASDPLVSLEEIPRYVEGLGFGLMDITSWHAIAELSPVPDTRNPFGRLPLAQCQVENLRLVTIDPNHGPLPRMAGRLIDQV